MSKKYYDPALLPALSNADLAELVRLKDITPEQEMSAKYRRATATMRSDSISRRYVEFTQREAAQKAQE